MPHLQRLISEQALQSRIQELGKEIRKHHGHKALTCICVLRGAIFFAADLVRSIGGEIRMEFIHIKNPIKSLDIEVDYISGSIQNQDCILIEDIVETGLTLNSLCAYLDGLQPKSLMRVSLLDKPSSRKEAILIDYIGFSIPDEFVVGYGLDLKGRYRALNHIATYTP